MEENVALSKKKQKSLETSVQKYKALLKKGEGKVHESVKAAKKAKRARGIIYLGNIPHGFYEEEMKEYFSQFGKVTRLRLCRSKKTGRSKGYAFIEYLVPDVAKVVAETMNGYLMFKRLLKAKYIAPEEQSRRYFVKKSYTADDYPRKTNRETNKALVNSINSEKQDTTYIKRILKHIKLTKAQLAKYDITYDFKPIDLPKGFTLKTNTALSRDSSTSKDSIENTGKDFIEKTKQIKKKSREIFPTSPTKQQKQIKEFSGTSKLFGVSKKSKRVELPVILKNKKKLNMIKNEILNSDQVKLKKAKDIKLHTKNKKIRK